MGDEPPRSAPGQRVAAVVAVLALGLLAAGAAGIGGLSGRAGVRGQPPGCPPGTTPHPERERALARPQWLAQSVVTEYWPVPERWFVGKLVPAPGLPGLHRVDWLYSGRGLPMEGDGVGLDGRRYHFGGPWHLAWVNAGGQRTLPCTTGSWSEGRPFWPAFGWRTTTGGVTFPLAGGGWSSGPPARRIAAPPELRFLPGPSLPLRYWHSLAVDARLIPLGSRVFVPVYCGEPNRGWFVAEDTGGTVISGHHVDVYRPAPSSPDGGQMFTGQKIFVLPAAVHAATRLPHCPGQGAGSLGTRTRLQPTRGTAPRQSTGRS